MHTESLRHPSYPQMAWIVSGSWAYYLILVFSVMEFFGIACVYVIFLWNNVYYLLCRFQIYGLDGFIHSNVSFESTDNRQIWSTVSMSEADQILIITLSIMSILPSILILKVSKMYWLSYGVLIGSIIMAFTLLTFIILHIIHGEELAHNSFEKLVPHGWHAWATNFSGFSISIGIFLFCFTSNAYSKLPLHSPYEKTNSKRTDVFDKILSRSFFLLFTMYVAIGIFGYLLYGKSCHSIILRNLMHHCKNIGLFCDLVCIFFVLITWSAIFPLIIRISDFIESNVIYEYLRNKEKQQCKSCDFDEMEQTNYSIRSIAKYLHQKHHKKHSLKQNIFVNTESVSSSSIIDDKAEFTLAPSRKSTEMQYMSGSSTKSSSFGGEVHNENPVVITDGIKRICRSIVFVLVLLIAWMFRNHSTFLEAIVGICFSTVTCMIFPCYLYLSFLWNTLSGWTKLMHILLIIFVVIAAIALLIGALVDFEEREDAANII